MTRGVALGRVRGKPSPVLVAVVALGFALWGCAEGAGDGPGSAKREGKILEVDAPLKSLDWNATNETLYGIEADGKRIVTVDPEVLTGIEFDGPRPDAVALSEALNVGDNLALDPRRPGEVYVPQPGLDRVRIVGTEDFDDGAQDFEVGVPPERVALDRRSDVLFALSRDGSTATRIELSANEITAERDLGAGPATRIETPGEGSGALWVAGPGMVALYGGPSLEALGRLTVEAAGLATEASTPDRAYVSQPEKGRVVAVEPGPEGRLDVVEKKEVGAGARYLAADEGRVYVATRGAVVVLDAENLKTAGTVDFGPYRDKGPLRRVEPSALTVGEDRIYVALAGEPYVLGLDKPRNR